ncbi:hypothetical protein VPH35_074330 [Triticum aestivum]
MYKAGAYRRATGVQPAPKEVICRRLQGNCRNARTVGWLDIVAMRVALRRAGRLSQTSSSYNLHRSDGLCSRLCNICGNYFYFMMHMFHLLPVLSNQVSLPCFS